MNMSQEREALIQERTQLMAQVEDERRENTKYSIKHLSPKSREILDRVWKLDENIMNITGTNQARVTISFRGKPKSSAEKPSDHSVRRTLILPSPFTYKQAREVAFQAVQEPDYASDSPAFIVKSVRHITNIAFN